MIFIVMKKKNGEGSRKVYPSEVLKVSEVDKNVIVTLKNDECISPIDKASTVTWCYMACPEIFSAA
jgi:hypothetical protein